MQQLFVKDQSALLTAFGKELLGYTPGKKYDASKWKFPVLLELDTTAKTFVLVQEEATKPSTKKETTPTATATETSNSKSKFSKLFPIVAAGVVAVAIIAVIIYNVVK